MSGVGVPVQHVAGNATDRSHRWFFVGCSLSMLAIVFAGFAPTFYLRGWFATTDYVTGGALLPHLVLHGLALSGWFAVFFAQTWLVASGRTALHRRLGVAGVVLAIAVVLSSAVTVVRSIPRLLQAFGASSIATLSMEAPARQAVSAIVVGNTFALLLFTCFVALAVRYRREPVVHKRLLFLASAAIIGPALAQPRPVGALLAEILPTPLVQLPIAMFVYVALLVWHDRAVRPRIEPSTTWGSLAMVASVVALLAVIPTDAAWSYVRWVAGL